MNMKNIKENLPKTTPEEEHSPPPYTLKLVVDKKIMQFCHLWMLQ